MAQGCMDGYTGCCTLIEMRVLIRREETQPKSIRKKQTVTTQTMKKIKRKKNIFSRLTGVVRVRAVAACMHALLRTAHDVYFAYPQCGHCLIDVDRSGKLLSPFSCKFYYFILL